MQGVADDCNDLTLEMQTGDRAYAWMTLGLRICEIDPRCSDAGSGGFAGVGNPDLGDGVAVKDMRGKKYG